MCVGLKENAVNRMVVRKDRERFITVHTISRNLCFVSAPGCRNSILKTAGVLLLVVYFGKQNLNVVFSQRLRYAMQTNTSGNLCYICVHTANKGM